MPAFTRHLHASNTPLRIALWGAVVYLGLCGAMTVALAGDLLRGGYTGTAGTAVNPTSFTSPSVITARANAKDALSRATQAIQAVQQMQASARSIAAASTKANLGVNPNNPTQQLPNVPNGLGIGGLQPVAGATAGSSLWSGANLPTQTTASGRTIVTVDQTSPDAILTWQSFNIGKSTTLDFDQSAGGAQVGNWIVFNKIEDPSGVPSQILGSIKAAGQVYVINQNGIIFGGASQVNVHTLVASSLPINNYLIGVGLANNPDDQFLFSSLTIPALASNPTAPTFTPPTAPNGYSGNVTVEAGAVLESPANADNVGGRIALVGPNVTNAGTIITPDGQTILAAGQQVGFYPHSSADATLRGLDVYVGAGGGAATNVGNIIAPEADVTMVGAAVNQLGVIQSTTSVSLNGRIDLDADWGTEIVQIPGVGTELEITHSGAVTFGNGSITDILPELDSRATITSADAPPNQALALNSIVNVQGETIHMVGDAELLAPDATVNMQAGEWLTNGNGGYNFEHSNGQIYLDSGALVDVAGSVDVDASVTQNIVAVQLLGPELADSPLQRNGDLRGQTIYVDIRNSGVYNGVEWIGTPLADAFGYASLVQYTVGELTIGGGTVTMQAGGSVVMQQGSEVNVSSGWIDYAGGMVTTSELISGGHIYNIAEATPDLVYSGFLPQFNVSNAKWGTSSTFNDPLITSTHYENGYVYGGGGGAITISAPATALQGTLLGLTENGPRQVGPDSVAATPSSISIAFEANNPAYLKPFYPVYSPTPPDVTFSADDNLPAPAAFSVDASGSPAPLGTAISSRVILSPDLLTTDGFGNLTIRDGDGNVTVPAGVTLDAGDGGSVTIAAANLDVFGSIIAPDGSISLIAYNYSPYQYTILAASGANTTPPANAGRGNFVLGAGAVLDVSGLLIDNRDGSPTADTQPMDTAGGSVKVTSYNVDIEAGSTINVSGGVALSTAGTPSYGAGGSIAIYASQDPDIVSLLGGRLTLDGNLEGFSGSKGGALTVQTENIEIGSATPRGGFEIDPSFFSQGGFSSFTIDSFGDLDIAPGTQLNPVATNLVAEPYSLQQGGLGTTTALLTVDARAPVSLSLNAEGVTDQFSSDVILIGNLVLGTGAVIETDPLGSVSLNGETVAILGSIYSPGGTVTIKGANTAAAYGEGNPTEALPTVYISSRTTISTAGTTIITPNNHGYTTGLVIPGGSISITGNIVAEAGSVLDVSGAASTLDESAIEAGVLDSAGITESADLQLALDSSFTGKPLVPVLIESNGGSITLKGTEELFSDATLIGQAGGSQAIGGALTISSGVFNPDASVQILPSQPTLIVTQNGLTIGGPTPGTGETALGHVVLGANGQPAAQTGHIAVSSFQDGGFGSIDLEGTVEFSGPVQISAAHSISVASNGILYADGAVTLTAPFVSLGTAFLAPTPSDEASSVFQANGNAFYLTPTYGTGSLTVNAQLINIGNLSLQGIGNLDLNASGGEIQGDGTLDIAGNVTLRAAEIYPPTESTFTIDAYNYTDAKGAEDSSVTIIGSGQAQFPLSAGGTLNIYASNITQDGVLLAPFGAINLGWNGTGTAPVDPITNTAVDATQNLVLGAESITSVSGVDPFSNQPVTVPYGVMLNGISWIDPSGVDITVSGAPQKVINLSAANITQSSGATVDIRGGGDLLAYYFNAGVNGYTDILNSTTSFAVIPGYSANYAPYAPFNPDRPTGSTELANLGSDAGYVNNTLGAGDTIYLAASNGLPTGYYTLLPARYAVMPGAYLVSAVGGTPGVGGVQPDGAAIVSGYRVGTGQAVVTNYEVESPSVVASEAEYDLSTASSFLGANSKARTPADSGSLILQATAAMTLDGEVLSRPIDPAAQGGLVEIESSPNEPIYITASGQASGQSSGDLVLDSGQLSSIGAQTLLIGGVASTGANGSAITVESNNIIVSNEGSPLSAGDVILVANDSITIIAGSSIVAQGESDSLDLSIAGDGALVRVSNDAAAQIVRTGVSTTVPGSLTIGADADLAGASVILDSSHTETLDPTAIINAGAVTLDSGLISITLPGANASAAGGLVLGGAALQQLDAHADSLTLLSYSSIDIYGSGQIGTAGLVNLTIDSAEIEGFDQSGGAAIFAAHNIFLAGNSNGTATAANGSPDGSLEFNGGVIHLGAGAMAVDAYSQVQLNATGGIIADGAGSLAIQGALGMDAPLITGAAGSQESIVASGALSISGASTKATVQGGMTGSLSLKGESIDDNGNISLPSGSISLTAASGDVVIGDQNAASLNVAGIDKSIFDATEYTPGGTVTLTAADGNVILDTNGTVDVSGAGSAGAGTLSVVVPKGDFESAGILTGAGGNGGSFALQAESLPSLAVLGQMLQVGGFSNAINIEAESGDVAVDGDIVAHEFDLSADQGSITVTGDIDVSGNVGGEITLAASGSVDLETGAVLDASAKEFSDAGKGGSVTLSAGADIDGQTNASAVVDVALGSTINLSVAANNANSQSLGDFTGTLLIRAPQNIAGTDVQVAPIEGTITGASAIVVEGFKVYNLTSSGGQITLAVENQIYNDGVKFLGADGVATASYTAMLNRLEAGSSNLDLNIETGAELINTNGNITLGTTTSTQASDWNLQNYRFGPDGTAGDLTIRASGNVIFYNTLSDGFDYTQSESGFGYDAALLAYNPLLPANIQSWSYTITAGADLASANTSGVFQGEGSVQIGKNDPHPIATHPGSTATTESVLNGFYQVVRTGAGNITISAGNNVELLNQFATVYTAGTQVADATMGGTFDVPDPNTDGNETAPQGLLGSEPDGYFAQYSDAGGNVSISAGNDITHLTLNSSGQLVQDSEKELPNNWLYRRGYFDSATDEFGTSVNGDVESTSWWVDFSNFFEGVGALGGGNVTLTAGHDVANVDAVVPTNARMPIGTPSASALVELGGGDVTVTAADDINAGVYYVERGVGDLTAGNEIITNSTRSPTLGTITSPATLDAADTWLPTTLFLGQGGFTVTAGENLLLGPVANVFLLPEGLNNTFWYKTYFSTYAATDSVDVTSLAGDVALREEDTTNGGVSAMPILETWMNNVDLFNSSSVSNYQPWLRLDETSVSQFSTALSILPPTLEVNALSGDVDIVGNLTLAPSPDGTLAIIAEGSINAEQPDGQGSGTTVTWNSSVIDVSDASPSAIPGVTDPFAYQSLVGTTFSARQTSGNFLLFLNLLFAESGQTNQVLQTKEELHGEGASGGPLHQGQTTPVELYAASGDISGLTLYSPTETRVVAGADITDIALYIQNVSASQISVVSAGNDIVAYDPDSPLRTEALSTGNYDEATSGNAGDIQISGPGTLEVLAGDELDLGVGPNYSSSTGVGITSIGNQRNPLLPQSGASVLVAAGIGPASDLSVSQLDFNTFINQFIAGAGGTVYLSELSSVEPELAPITSVSQLDALPAEQRDLYALDLFYLVLRDAGREHNLVGSPGFGNYSAAFEAIADLFPDPAPNGDISLTSREIATENGGDINVLDPAGELNVGFDIVGNQSLNQGIFTEDGGNISIYTEGSVNVGTSRIFTLRGGNEIIWSTAGNIAAGESPKTVQEAPPTQVIVDPQSANVETDLGGLATGGGIGVLASVQGVPAGNVDLVAPSGTVDAGDAGIRVTGNLNIAAVQVLNVANIQVGGASVGVPAPVISVPNIAGLTAAANSAGAGASDATTTAETAQNQANTGQVGSVPIVTVEVVGYGGDED